MSFLISNCIGEIALKDLPTMFQLLIGLPFNRSLLLGNGSNANASLAKFLFLIEDHISELSSFMCGLIHLPNSLRAPANGILLLSKLAVPLVNAPGFICDICINWSKPDIYVLPCKPLPTTNATACNLFSAHSVPISSMLSPMSAIVENMILYGSKDL